MNDRKMGPRSAIAEELKRYLSPLLSRVVQARVAEGVRKYGQTLDENVRTRREKTVHLVQELLDAASYAVWRGDLMLAHRLSMDASRVADSFQDWTLEELLHKEGYTGGGESVMVNRRALELLVGAFDEGASDPVWCGLPADLGFVVLNELQANLEGQSIESEAEALREYEFRGPRIAHAVEDPNAWQLHAENLETPGNAGLDPDDREPNNHPPETDLPF